VRLRISEAASRDTGMGDEVGGRVLLLRWLLSRLRPLSRRVGIDERLGNGLTCEGVRLNENLSLRGDQLPDDGIGGPPFGEK